MSEQAAEGQSPETEGQSPETGEQLPETEGLLPETEGRAPEKKNLKVNAVYNFISKILVLVVPLITTPYLARILHEEGIGQISFVTSIITYFTLFANLGFDTYGQREIAKRQDDKYQKSLVFWEIIVVKSVLTLLSLGVLFAVSFTVGFGGYTTLVVIMSLQVLACAFDLQFFFQGEEDFKSLTIRTIFVKLVILVLIFVAVRDEGDVWLYVLFNALLLLVSNLAMWPALRKRICRVKLADMRIWRHFLPALLIFLPTLAVTIYSVFDKTMIGLLSANPDYDNGCYEQAYKLNSVALLLVTIVPYVLVPRNAYDYAGGNRERMDYHIHYAINYVFMVGFPLILGFVALAPNLSSWFLGEGYDEVPVLLCIMSVRFICSGLSVILSDSIFIVIGKEKYVIISSVVAAVFNVGLNALLIPDYGAVGAAVATAIAEGSICLVLGIIAVRQKFISLKKTALMSIKYIISALIMFAAIWFMQMYLPYTIWSFIAITVVGMVVYGLMLLILRDRFTLDILGKFIAFIRSKIHKKS